MSTVRDTLNSAIAALQAEINTKSASIATMQSHATQLPPQILDMDHDAWMQVKALIGAPQQ
ncbi:MAG: hypothetical protein KGH75_05815 [Rhodospirillales bacterium]|nr:hypothetical protein [Rhodospirillales bacterium]